MKQRQSWLYVFLWRKWWHSKPDSRAERVWDYLARRFG